jgi:DNA-binding transcriptional LysR family regulator
MQGLDWSDLQVFAAIAERGSLAAAARALAVNHTTVARRIHALEKRLGVRLFRRLATGYILTQGGEELRGEMRGIQSALADVERRLAGKDARLTGALRVSTTDTLATTLLMPHLRAFRAQHAGVDVTLTTSNSLVNLSRHDADVVIRPAPAPPGSLVGTRIATVGFAAYVARGSTRKFDVSRLSASEWVGLDDSLADTSVGRWLRTRMSAASVALRVDSFVAARDAVAADIALAALPCYLGDSDPRLARVTPPLPELATELWLLTHKDLRRTARVRSFMQFVAAAFRRQRRDIEG